MLGKSYFDFAPKGDRSSLERAIECFSQDLHVLDERKWPLFAWDSLYMLGKVYFTLADGKPGENLDKAIATLKRARDYLHEDMGLVWQDANRNLGEAYLVQGNWTQARAYFEQAIRTIERSHGTARDLAEEWIRQGRSVYRNAAGCALECGDVEQAFLTLDAGKTWVLRERLRLQVNRPASVPEELWSRFKQARVQFEALPAKPSVLDERSAGMAQMTRILWEKLDSIVGEIRKYEPDFPRKELDIDAILDVLPDSDTAVVTFCTAAHATYGLVLSLARDMDAANVGRSKRGQARFVKIESFCKRDLDSLIKSWLKDYQGSTEADWEKSLERVLTTVGTQMLSRVLSILPQSINRILFAPSGGLSVLPLHAVPISEDGSERVCDRYEVGYIPSLALLVDTYAKAGWNLLPSFYGVINPNSDLLFAHYEGEAIRQIFPNHTVDEGQMATKQQIRTATCGQAYLHFACHGRYKWDEPRDSFLQLTDARLTLGELLSGWVDLTNARLITLSACESGITDVLKGSEDEFLGLPAGFLAAGVPCIVSTLWKVHDLSTALLMDQFYKNLAEKMTVWQALREAQLWVRQLEARQVAEYAETCYRQFGVAQHDKLLEESAFRYRKWAETDPSAKPFAHPYYWAAFTVNGM